MGGDFLGHPVGTDFLGHPVGTDFLGHPVGTDLLGETALMGVNTSTSKLKIFKELNLVQRDC